MKELVFFLEEESAKVMLVGVLAKIIKQTLPVRYVVFEGKQDLEKQIIKKLRGYNNREAFFIILRDQDSADCISVKNELKQKCITAGKPDAIVRIACRELESWYLSDLTAVEKAYSKKGISEIQAQKKYRNPDHLGSPSRELKKIVPEYQKIEGSRLISNFLDINNSRSTSFYHLIESIKKIAAQIGENQ